MVLEFSTTQVATNTKEDGVIIKDTAREPSGFATPKTNLEDSTPETGKMTIKKAEEQCSTNQEIDMMECGWKIFLTGRAE